MRHIFYDGHSRWSVVNEGFVHVMNDHIHEPNNLMDKNE